MRQKRSESDEGIIGIVPPLPLPPLCRPHVHQTKCHNQQREPFLASSRQAGLPLHCQRAFDDTSVTPWAQPSSLPCCRRHRSECRIAASCQATVVHPPFTKVLLKYNKQQQQVCLCRQRPSLFSVPSRRPAPATSSALTPKGTTHGRFVVPESSAAPYGYPLPVTAPTVGR